MRGRTLLSAKVRCRWRWLLDARQCLEVTVGTASSGRWCRWWTVGTECAVLVVEC
jgi:hypothetical protein